MNQYYKKYLKYKNKYIELKQQKGGSIKFTDFPINIYHAFNEKIRDVKTKIKDLSENGITHIQLSPIQKCRKSVGKILMKKKRMQTDSTMEWWLAYQPLNYEIGNFYGSKTELIELIDECAKYNIEIVSDIVINHISALIDFEYPIYNILLLITGIDNIKNYPDFTMWDIYYYYNNIKTEENKLESYLKSILPNSYDKFNINRLIIDALIDYELIYDETIIPIDDKNKLNELRDNYKKTKDNNDMIIYIKTSSSIIQNNLNKINLYIDKLFIDIKNAICEYLLISPDNFIDEYYDILTAPYYCTNDVSYGYNCWLGQALPQLNQKNKLVRKNILKFLEELSKLKIKCLRIDAVTHMQPEIIKFYIDYFNYITKEPTYIYSELINVQGTKSGYINNDYIKYTHITEYNLIINLLNIFCYNCDLNNLNVLHLPSGDIGSVVFSTTHDLIRINNNPPALSGFSNYDNIRDNEPYKIVLMICYLIQRIYNVPLILNTQYDDTMIDVKSCCKFRKFLADNKCNIEKSYTIENRIFVSDKYYNNKLLGTFYMNISDTDYMHNDINIKKQNIIIKY